MPEDFEPPSAMDVQNMARGFAFANRPRLPEVPQEAWGTLDTLVMGTVGLGIAAVGVGGVVIAMGDLIEWIVAFVKRRKKNTDA